MASFNSEKISFNAWHRTMQSQLIKFRNEELYYDVIIRIRKQSFKCHRLVLAAKSEYFDRMFGGSFKESYADEVVLEGIEPIIFASVLDYIYTGHLPHFTADNISSLFYTSEYLLLEELLEGCFQFLRENISSIDDLIDIVLFARAANLIEPLQECIIINFHRLFMQGKLLELPFEELDSLLEHYRRPLSEFEFFRFRNEDIIFHLVNEWIAQCSEERDIHYHQLTKYISSMGMSNKYIAFAQQHYDILCNSNLNREISCEQEIKYSDIESFIPFKKYPFPEEMPTVHIVAQWHSLTQVGDSHLITFSLDNDDGPHWLASNCHPLIHSEEYKITRNVVYGHESLLYTFQAEANFLNPSQTWFSAAPSMNPEDPIYTLTTPPCHSRFYDICAKENDGIYWYNLDILNESCYNTFNCHTTLNEEEIRRGIYRYLPEIDTWLALPKMDIKIEYPSVIADDNLFYVIGGKELYQKRNVYAIDHHVGQWMSMPQTNSEYCTEVCCSMNGIIYTSNFDIVETYDSRAGKWNLLADLSNVCPMAGSKPIKGKLSNSIYSDEKYMVAHENLLWIFSHNNDNFYTFIIDPYEPSNNNCCTSDLLETTILQWQNYLYGNHYHLIDGIPCKVDTDNWKDNGHIPVVFSAIRDVVVHKEKNSCFDESDMF